MSSSRATSRALRPRSDASFLNCVDLLEDEDRDDDFVVRELEDRAGIVEENVGIEDEMFHFGRPRPCRVSS